MSDTIFMRIIAREIPADIVYEDDTVLAFRDIAPKAPVHILIIPKKPIPTLNDVIEEDVVMMGNVIRVAGLIARQEGIHETGYRLVMNCNGDAGQTVFHVHAHLLGGRELGWPPG